MNRLVEGLFEKVTVMNELGLHARPAAKIATLASKATSPVWLIKNGKQVDASSIIDILSLGCTKGTSITLKIENPKDITILKGIVELISRGFKE